MVINSIKASTPGVLYFLKGIGKMTTIKKNAEVPYTTSQMYDLVTAIQDYPKFLSWCKEATVQSRTPQKIQATIHGEKWGINFGFSFMYQMQSSNMISIHLMHTGPFRFIKSLWRFQPLDKGGCQFGFELEYEFANPFYNWTLTPLIKGESNNIMKAFAARAKEIYS